MDDSYGVGAGIVGIIGAICIWIYAIVEWGLLLGLVFGWIPALIGGFIVGLLWPLVVLGILGILFLMFVNS